ncbi:MAG TPA: Ig-like domain-containing protein [Gemmatimonadales bacterium]
MIRPLRSFASILVFALVAGIASCGGDGIVFPGDSIPTSMTKVTGDAQAGIVGAALPLPLVVKVADKLGRPVVNQDVEFLVLSGGGQVAAGTVATGSDGRASTTWTLGPNAGSQQVRAQAVGGEAPATLLVTFDATAIAGSGSLIAALSGDDQTAPVNSSLGDSLVVRVSDASDNPVEGVTIQWSAVGGGSVSPETVITGADGRGATARVLGPTAGQQSAQAAADGLAGSPVTFVHTAVASNPTTLTEVSGNGQTAPAGFELAEDLVVKLSDADGNGVGGRAVSWVVSTGGGTVTPVNSTTDPSGFARTRWTLGSTAGQNTLTAVFSGIPPVPFSATGSSDVPTKLTLQSGDNQSAPGGQALPNPLAVRVTDANDNPVENVSVSWTANGGGSVSAPTSATNALGIAQITRTLGPTPGPYTTTAAVSGLTGSPITFNSSATVGQPTQIVVTTQPSAAAVNGVQLAQQPVVQLQDAQGNDVGPVPGRTVTAALLPLGGGTLGGDRTKVSDANGLATYTDLSLTAAVGTYNLRFTSPGLTTATSNPIALGVGAPSAATSIVTANPTSVGAGDPSTISVTALDGGGNPVSGVTVSIQASGSGNSFGQPTGPTDINGQTTGTFSSTSPGSHTVTATLNGSITVTDNAIVTVTAGSPASIAIQDGNNQTADVGTAVTTDPAVIVRDASSNPVAGVQVDFAVGIGGGGVTGATATTNSSGIATVGSWTMGPTAGSNNNTLTATVNGTAISVTFTASASAGSPSVVVITTQPSGNAQAGVAFGTQPVIQLQDNGGNNSATSGVTITATIASGPGGATLSNATATTNGSGVATFSGLSINGTVGTYTLTFDSGSLTEDTSDPITLAAGPAETLQFTQQPSDAASGATITPAVVVSVEDAFGNPASGTVHLDLNVPLAANATLNGDVDVDAVGGQATFSDLSVDQTGNVFNLPYSLDASTSGVSAVQSSNFDIN